MPDLEQAGIKAIVQGIDGYLSDLKKMSSGTSQLGKDLEGSGKASEGFGKSVASTAAGFATAQLAMKGLSAAFDFGIGNAMNFQKGLSSVAAVSGATKDQLGQLSDTALRIGKDTAFSASQAVGAMEELAANGITTGNIINGAADAAANLAAAGGVDLPFAAATASTAMAAWNLKTSDLNDVVNRLAGAANASRFGVEDMSQAIAAGGGAAATAGISFADFTTSIAATAASFSSGSDAGTSFKTFVLNLEPATKTARDTMESLGIVTADGGNAFFTAAGQAKPLADIVQVLHEKVSTLTAQEQVTALKNMFGADAFRTAAGLMKLTGDEFTTMSGKMRDTSAADVAKVRMDNLSGSFESLKGSMETVGINIGTKVIPVLTDITNKAILAINAWDKLPGSTQNLVLGFGAIAGAAPIAMAAVGKLVEILKSLKTAEDGTGGIGTAGKLGGIAAIIAGIGIAGDALLQKTTGHGIVEWVLGNPGHADRVAEALRRVNDEVQALTAQHLDPQAVIFEKIEAAMQGVNREAERLGTSNQNTVVFFDTFGKYNATMGDATANVEAYGKKLVELNTPTALLVEVHNKLSGALQSVFDTAVGYESKLAAMNEASARAASSSWALDDAFRALPAAAAPATSSIDGLRYSATQVASYMSTGWGPTISAAYDSLSADTKAKLGQIGAKDFPDLQQSAQSLSDYLSAKFGPELAKAFDKNVADAKAWSKGVTDSISPILPAVDDTFTKWKARLDKMAVDQATFKENLSAIYAELVSRGTQLPEQYIAALVKAGPEATAAFRKIFFDNPTATVDELNKTLPVVLGKTGDALTAEITGWNGEVDLAIQNGFVHPAVTAIQNGTQPMTAAMQADLDQLTIDVTTGAASAGRAVGAAIMLGITGGITGGQLAADMAAARAAQDIIASFNRTLGTHSPSRVANEEVGVPIIQGVEQGMIAESPNLFALAATTALMAVGIMQGIVGNGMPAGGGAGATGPGAGRAPGGPQGMYGNDGKTPAGRVYGPGGMFSDDGGVSWSADMSAGAMGLYGFDPGLTAAREKLQPGYGLDLGTTGLGPWAGAGYLASGRGAWGTGDSIMGQKLPYGTGFIWGDSLAPFAGTWTAAAGMARMPGGVGPTGTGQATMPGASGPSAHAPGTQVGVFVGDKYLGGGTWGADGVIHYPAGFTPPRGATIVTYPIGAGGGSIDPRAAPIGYTPPGTSYTGGPEWSYIPGVGWALIDPSTPGALGSDTSLGTGPTGGTFRGYGGAPAIGSGFSDALTREQLIALGRPYAETIPAPSTVLAGATPAAGTSPMTLSFDFSGATFGEKLTAFDVRAIVKETIDLAVSRVPFLAGSGAL